MATEQRVGVVGLGKMGWPMAARLCEAGFPVTVHDTRQDRTAAFVAEFAGRTRAARAARPDELAARSDVIITMLPDSGIVETVLFGDNGVAAGLTPDAIVVEMSSGIPDRTIGFASRLAERGAGLIDAPVSGGVRGAEAGTLAIMAGGPDDLVERCVPVLEAMGKVMRTGGLGSGQAMKSLNNLVSAGGFLIGIEALLIGRKFGLDPETMVDILNASTGSNNSTQKKFRQFVLSGSYDSGFALDLMAKDLGIALGIAANTSAATPFAALCREIWTAAANGAEPGADHTELARLCERLSGAELSGTKVPRES